MANAVFPQHIVKPDTVHIGDGLEQDNVGQRVAPLPLGHRLVGVIQSLRKFGLGQIIAFSKLAYILCEYTSQIIHKPIISAKIAACKSNIIAFELPVLRLYRQENASLPTILPSNKGEDELPRSEQYNESVK